LCQNNRLFIFKVYLLIYFAYFKIQLRYRDDKLCYNFFFFCTDSGSFCNTALAEGVLDTILFAVTADFVAAAGPAVAVAHATCCMLLPHCRRHFTIIFMQSFTLDVARHNNKGITCLWLPNAPFTTSLPFVIYGQIVFALVSACCLWENLGKFLR